MQSLGCVIEGRVTNTAAHRAFDQRPNAGTAVTAVAEHKGLVIERVIEINKWLPNRKSSEFLVRLRLQDRAPALDSNLLDLSLQNRRKPCFQSIF
jgi:hypothetical protein